MNAKDWEEYKHLVAEKRDKEKDKILGASHYNVKQR